MNSDMDKYLDHVDRWKLRVHTKLKNLSKNYSVSFGRGRIV